MPTENPAVIPAVFFKKSRLAIFFGIDIAHHLGIFRIHHFNG